MISTNIFKDSTTTNSLKPKRANKILVETLYTQDGRQKESLWIDYDPSDSFALFLLEKLLKSAIFVESYFIYDSEGIIKYTYCKGSEDQTMTEQEVKLPKQWKHWLEVVGFDKSTRRYKQHLLWMYWKGHGRHWRINCYGQMQVSKKFNEFDRWANSVQYTTEGIPTTQQEFIDRVNFMLKRCERKERLINKFCFEE